jgi:hypothetical protein
LPEAIGSEQVAPTVPKQEGPIRNGKLGIPAILMQRPKTEQESFIEKYGYVDEDEAVKIKRKEAIEEKEDSGLSMYQLLQRNKQG